MPATVTPADINGENREFWDAQQLLLERRMADTTLREAAFEVMRDEIKRGMPIKYQKSIYAALEDAEKAKRRFSSERGRQGGLAKKTDALQELIEQFVQDEPSLTEFQLRAKLQQCERIPPIEDICDGVVHFTNQDGRSRGCRLSSLKDRLSRAKKKHRSR
jgi:hypothetical protein